MREKMSSLIKFPRLLILLLLITFPGFLGVLFTPSLPQIAGDFGVSENMAQWTMSIFLIGYAIGQLPYGPLANRFGRKKAIAIGFTIALVGTLLAYTATAFWALCLARFIQALGSAVGLKIAFTMVGDLHAGEMATKAISTLTLAFGIMPGLATAIGGYITVIWGWQGCFLFLALYTFGLWLLCIPLPETARELQKDALDLNKIGHGLAKQMKDPFLMLHAFLTGLTTTIVYVFATLSPYIAIEKIGISPDQFGLWAFVPSLGIFTGSLISRTLSSRLNSRINMLCGILIVITGAAVLSVCFANSWITVWSLFIPTYFIYMGSNLIWTNASSKGISESKDKSNASAVIQFANMGTATIGVFLIGAFSPTAAMLLPAALGIIIILMFVTWLKLKEHHK